MIGRTLILVTTLCLTAVASEKSVDISLRANWFKTPFPLLLLETVASENESGFHTILDAMFDVSFQSLEFEDADLQFDAIPFAKSDKELYDAWSQKAGATAEKSITDIYLANKYYAPRVQSHYQHYNEIKSSILGDKCGTNPKAWLYFNNEVYCNSDDVFALKTGSKRGKTQLLPFDRVIGAKGDDVPVAIIYGDYRSPLLSQFLSNLAGFIKDGRLRLVWRYIPDKSTWQKETLAGYGVDLTLKNTEYSDIDDRGVVANKPVEAKPTVVESNDFWDVYSKEIEPVSEKDISLLGYKLTHYVKSLEVSESEKLSILTKLIQDFPKYASFINRQVTDTDATESIEDRWENSFDHIPQGLYINGAAAAVPQSDLNYMDILSILKREYAFIDDLTKFGVAEIHAQDIMKRFAAHVSDRSVNNTMFKRFDIRGHADAITYLNDIETDPWYSNLSSSREPYTRRPIYTTGFWFPPVRENIHELVFVIDLEDQDQVNVLLNEYYSISEKKPLRIGLVPFSEYERLDEKFLHVVENKGIHVAIAYLHHVATTNQTNDWGLPVNLLDLGCYCDVCYTDSYSKVGDFIRNFSITHGTVIANGKFFDLGKDWWCDPTSKNHPCKQLSTDIVDLGKAISSGALSADMRAQDFLYKGSQTSRNPSIDAVNEKKHVYGFPELIKTDILSFVPFDSLETFKIIEQNEKSIATVVMADQPDSIPITIWLIGYSRSLNFLFQLSHLISAASDLNSVKIRVYDTSLDPEFTSWLQAKMDNSSAEDLITLIDGRSNGRRYGRYHRCSEDAKDFVLKTFNLQVSNYKDLYVILNGRVVRIGGDSIQRSKLLDLHLKQLVEYETDLKLQIAYQLLSEYNISTPETLDRFELFEYFTMSIFKTYYFGDGYQPDEKLFPRYNTNLLDDTLSIEIAKSDAEGATMEVALFIDPLQEESQKLVSLLSLFEGLNSVRIRVILNPQKGNELDIKRFYRGVFPNSVKFNSTGFALDNEDKALFVMIPEKNLFTLDLDVPKRWLVVIKEAGTDLDNVLLENSGKVKGVYELKSLLVEGHACETQENNAIGNFPVELLGHSETRVMNDYGYFQLQANPGLWNFAIKPYTKEAAMLQLVDLLSKFNDDKIQYAVLDGTAIIPVLNMNGNIIQPFFDSISDQEKSSLLGNTAIADKESPSKLWSSWNNQEESKNADINIFTVTSGSLDERFLSVMANSVMKHTEHTVKFWLIENYLSPTFRKILPYLAQKFGFNYELINYKWPAFLRGQKEKKRNIWGYKILFLDVLFPQSLDKVIFVDADQIVRADLKELVDLDLEGAPYGYTPMCDDREEMEEFRFWKQESWQKSLGDTLRYHNSALYVIDLKTFRKMKAGLMLRFYYTHLSQDPSSLSKLNQDLLNHAQAEIKIFSLPEQWLWCETWCSDERLKTAKTINFCSNPLTKEPKLDRARRTSEWVQYNDEVQQVIDEVSASAKKLGPEHDELYLK
ncbi:BA75_01747T0 [Komagataella pastoris]|uniref:BA75_01747T0 n=1 Tax=Komagataella pastoris TaxID=4922 RepID=A0A1B2J8R6_PICPA|nr:BA75_01747T0 [Komagataella pastoris]